MLNRLWLNGRRTQNVEGEHLVHKRAQNKVFGCLLMHIKLCISVYNFQEKALTFFWLNMHVCVMIALLFTWMKRC